MVNKDNGALSSPEKHDALDIRQVFDRLEDEQADRLAESHIPGRPYSLSVAYHAPSGTNRYSNILPFDENRVKLKTPSRAGGSDYVNASSITHSASGTSKRWIASQGPTERSAADFWNLVWQEDVEMIVQLCKFEERLMSKCWRYLPLEVEDQPMTFVADAGNSKLKVKLLLVDDTQGNETQIRALRLCQGEVSRTVTHVLYHGWPDFGRPSTTAQLSTLVSLTRKLQNGSTAPPVIHCSAGCGRTGTFCAMDVLMDNPDHDLYALVDSLRKQRPSMVQALPQLELLHEYQRERRGT
ncbi:phosphotyrosine-specific ptp2-like protein [Savitreella phatthalungensis]